MSWGLHIAGVALVGASVCVYALGAAFAGLDDKFVHLASFAGLGCMAHRAPLRFSVPALCALSAALEVTQGLLWDSADVSIIDFAASLLGALLGLSCARAWDRAPLRALAMMLAFSVAFDAAYQFIRPRVVQLALDHALARALETDDPLSPWPYAPAEVYGELQFIRQNVETVVLNDISPQALAAAPGLWRASPEPADAGVSVFYGHRDGAFAVLGQLRVGDRVRLIRATGPDLDFFVAQTRITPTPNIGVRPWRDTPGVALATCWPIGSTQPSQQRLVVLLSPLHRNAQAVHGAERTGS